MNELSTNPEKPELGTEVNVNGVIQFVFGCFFILVAVILSNLVVALTVNKTDELFKKADIHHNVKRVKQIDELEKLLPKMFWNQVQLLPYLMRKLSGSRRSPRRFLEDAIHSHDCSKRHEKRPGSFGM